MSVKTFAEAVKEGFTKYTRGFGIAEAEEEEAEFAQKHEGVTKAEAETIAGEAVKKTELPAATAVAIANIASLSGIPAKGETDEVTLAEGNIVLCPNQTTASQRGPWEVKAAAWVRPAGFAHGSEQLGAFIGVALGAKHAGSLWVMTNATKVTVDTTAQTWEENSAAAGVGLTKAEVEAIANAAVAAGAPTLKIGLNGLYAYFGAHEAALGLKRDRINVGGGPGSARTQGFGNEGISHAETFLKKGEGRTVLPIYVPRLAGEVEVFTRLTHAQVKEDVENLCKWIVKLSGEIGYKGITELEFLNESYYAYAKLFSAKEYAELYAVAHAVCTAYGITLIANAWGDVQELENRLETELAKEAPAKSKTVELASVAGMTATGTVVLEEESLGYSKIVGKVVTLTSETAVVHKAAIAKSVYATTTTSEPYSKAEGGGGWCFLIGKALAEIGGAPKFPDAWSLHPYGAMDVNGTGTLGWQTTFSLMDILREQGIYAPMHVTEMGNAVTGEGGVAGPELSKQGVREALTNYLRDCQAHGVVDFIGFYNVKQGEEEAFQKVWAHAVTSGVAESGEDWFGIEEVEIGAGGRNWFTGLRSVPRTVGVELYGKAKAEYILTVEEGYEAGVLTLKLFKYEAGAVPKEVASGTKVKIIWWARK